MSSFLCPLCQNSREFITFGKFFHHITLFHQNEHHFHITCDLNLSCGVSYRTYAAYKAHVYRHHGNELHLSEQKQLNLPSINNNEYSSTNSNVDMTFLNNHLTTNANNEDDNDLSMNISEADSNYNNQETTHTDVQNFLRPCLSEESNVISLTNIQKSFTYFMMQLREEFSLPKIAINSISNYIVTLINNLQSLLEQQSVPSDPNNTTNTLSSNTIFDVNKNVIELQVVRKIMNDVCHTIESVTNNEYQFLKCCEKYFNYISPQEIIVSAPDEKIQCSYYVPISQTLMSILQNQETTNQIFDNIRQQQDIVASDADVMFSFRDGSYGSRIDDDSLLLQLYADEIGLTNPIGAKKDRHKMFMLYFSLNDMPDEYRSQLDQIYLVALCETSIIKVTHFIICIVDEFYLTFIFKFKKLLRTKMLFSMKIIRTIFLLSQIDIS